MVRHASLPLLVEMRSNAGILDEGGKFYTLFAISTIIAEDRNESSSIEL